MANLSINLSLRVRTVMTETRKMSKSSVQNEKTPEAIVLRDILENGALEEQRRLEADKNVSEGEILVGCLGGVRFLGSK